MKQSYEKRDVKAEISDFMADFLEEHHTLPNYQKEWEPGLCQKVLPPHNPISGTVYSGANFWMLSASPQAIESGDFRFITFAQAVDAGYHVKKGAKSLPVIYAGAVTVNGDERDDQEIPADRPSGRFLGRFVKHFNVFAASQIDGIPPLEQPTVEPVTWSVPAGVQAVLDGCGIPIEERGDKAFYSRRTKTVTVPPKHAFTGDTDEIKAAKHASVLVHEVFHGLEDRLGLAKSSRFGDEEYSRGEMRVELATAMACRYYNLPVATENQAAYAASWARNLRSDRGAFFRAVREAGMIFDEAMKHDPDYEPAPSHEDSRRPLDHVLPASALPRPASSPSL